MKEQALQELFGQIQQWNKVEIITSTIDDKLLVIVDFENSGKFLARTLSNEALSAMSEITIVQAVIDIYGEEVAKNSIVLLKAPKMVIEFNLKTTQLTEATS